MFAVKNLAAFNFFIIIIIIIITVVVAAAAVVAVVVIVVVIMDNRPIPKKLIKTVRYRSAQEDEIIRGEIQDDRWPKGDRQPIVCCKTHASYGYYYVIRYRRLCARSLVLDGRGFNLINRYST
ncbi:hypothetical protein ElyMa_000311300 [Elysia marginata]|uniref:Uncharacterized protein n=1 Tax=Elysia marginata TaxID=1093978 RepID=A0AAV4FAP7_9GAST|nr:hypothetical protein ElyMa_000311300 [Elysia marginata]